MTLSVWMRFAFKVVHFFRNCLQIQLLYGKVQYNSSDVSLTIITRFKALQSDHVIGHKLLNCCFFPLCILKCLPCGADVPSAPSIGEVQPYSSTAQVLFEEPESTGGVPVLKYRAQWRAVGRGKWVQRVYEVKDGKFSPAHQVTQESIVLNGTSTS